MLQGEIPDGRRGHELNVLGSLMLESEDEARELAFAELTVREFSTPDLRRLFQVLQRARERGKPLNDAALMFDEALAAGFSSADAAQVVADALNAVPHSVHLPYYVSTLRAEHQRDELRGLALRLAEKAGDRTTAPEQAIGEALEGLERLRAGNAGGKLIDTEAALAAFDASRDSGAAFATGFAGLDRLLSGGLRPGQLVVVGARPSAGKSALLQAIAHKNAAAGRGVFFASGEMTCAELAGRALKAIGREHFRGLPVWFAETSDLRRLVSETRLAVRRFGVRLVVCDYIQLFADGLGGRNSTRAQDVGLVSRGLKRLAIETQVAILAAAQLNRASESKDRPSMSDLNESGNIEADADSVWLLKQSDDDGSGLRDIEISVVKQRSGPRGKVDLQFNGRKFEFHEPAFELADSPGEGWRI